MIIVIVTLIIQSFILSLYYGITISNIYFYLIFDLLLIVGLKGYKLLMFLLIGSICLQNELICENDVHIKNLYISMRFVLSANILINQEKLIYMLFTTFYLLFRTNFYLYPIPYLTIMGYFVLSFKTYYFKIKDTQPKQIIQLLHFFEECLPVPMCIIQDDQFVFATREFKFEYFGLTPSIIKSIQSKSNQECLATYLNKRKPQEHIKYEWYNNKKLEFCTLDQQVDQHLESLFPANITIGEIIWQSQPATVLIFQTQYEKVQIEKMRELEIRDQLKDDTLASASHEFKTPINGILAILQRLEESLDEPEDLNLITILRKWTSLLMYMISDILDFSKMQKKEFQLSNSTFFLRDIIQEIVDLISFLANQKGIVVEQQINIGKDLMFSDPLRIKQILLNLLSNSLKFTEKGRIDIVVNYKYQDPSNSQKLITILVKDTGVGIPDHIKPKLFTMYGTFDFTKNGSNKHGVGLGLVICKKLVGLLGPTDNIELQSQVGVGTQFSFDIFVNNDQRSPQTHQQEITTVYNKLSTADGQLKTITSQFTIFNKQQTTISIHKKLNKKNIMTQYDIPDKKIPHSAYPIRNIQRKKSQKRSIKKTPIGDQANCEDSDQSKYGNIRQYIEQNCDLTYASFQIKKEISPLNNNNLSQRIDSNESPAIQSNVIKPQEVRESLDQMMKSLFPNPTYMLVVDDSPVNVFSFRLILQKYNHIIVEEAYNGRQAIQKITANAQINKKYSYIFMDLTMPIMNGYEATEIIRNMEKNKQIDKNNIIALTGYDDIKEKEKCQELSFDAFITKPIKIVDIISVVNEVNNIRNIQ